MSYITRKARLLQRLADLAVDEGQLLPDAPLLAVPEPLGRGVGVRQANLESAVIQKMAYNASRPHKHGKVF